MSHDDSHSLLDDQLRSVPVPAGMLARLREIPAERVGDVTDCDLDDMLTTVAMPRSVTVRLHELIADEVLDRRLRDVDPPVRTLARARIIPRQPRRSRVWATAGATALLLLLTVGYLGLLGGMLWEVHPETRPVATFVYHGPLEMNGQVTGVEVAAPVNVVQVSPRPVMAVPQASEVAVPQFATPAKGVLVDWQRELDRGLDPWQDVMLLKWDVLGAPPSTEHLAMQTVAFPEAKGLSLPLARGYDRRFLNVHGVHPPMFLGVNPGLRRAALPLTTRTDSFLRLQADVAAGEEPETDEVRVEEFLAAMQYGFAAPKSKAVGIRVAAGPALFGDGRSQMIQVGVKAQAQPVRRVPATHLVIGLDASESMGWGSRWESVQAGLRRVLTQLGPHDRLSIVGFNEQIVLDVEDVDRNALQPIMRALSALQPSGGSALSRGLARCASVANQAVAAPRTVQLVLVTDGDLVVNSESLPPLAGMLADLARQDVRCQILELGQAGPQAALETLANAAETRVATVSDGDALGERLLAMLLGSSATVACDVKLTVTFDPKAVVAYRLLGHEANAVALLDPPGLRSDLTANAEAVGLYEVWLRPGKAVELGTVEMTWRDPATGQRHRQQQRMTRLQLATSWEECALSLQLAQLVAEAADVLRGGYRFELAGDGTVQPKRKPQTMRHVLDALDYTHPALLERADVSDFVQLMEQLSRVK